MWFLSLLIILFCYWLFSSRTKKQDIWDTFFKADNISAKAHQLARKQEERARAFRQEKQITDVIKHNQLMHYYLKQAEELGINLDGNTADTFKDLQVSSLPDYFINFIYITYYITGLKNFPNLGCVKNVLRKNFPDYSIQEFPLIWNGIINKLEFDQTKLKKINGIYHFTHISNLSSILNDGLISRAVLDKYKKQYIFNDFLRLDNMRNSTSLSLSHPNYKMFFKYRENTNNNDWVVLKISTELLSGNTNNKVQRLNEFDYFNKATFCKKNAASTDIRYNNIEERKSYKAFLEAFESPIGKTLENYPFDPQAEILFYGNIPKEFIEEVCIYSTENDIQWAKELGYKVIVNKQLFEKR